MRVLKISYNIPLVLFYYKWNRFLPQGQSWLSKLDSSPFKNSAGRKYDGVTPAPLPPPPPLLTLFPSLYFPFVKMSFCARWRESLSMYIAKELAQQHLVSTSKMRGKRVLDSFSYYFFSFSKTQFCLCYWCERFIWCFHIYWIIVYCKFKMLNTFRIEFFIKCDGKSKVAMRIINFS